MSAAVLVVIPCLNEVEHIVTTVRMIAGEGLTRDLELVVVDGGSTDGTLDLLEKLSEEISFEILANPARLQSAGVNSAVRRRGAGHQYLLRVDAHGGYPEGFLPHLLDSLDESGADSVVVTMDTIGGLTTFQDNVAIAQNSRIGNGGSPHRNTQGSGRWVEHGHHALFKMAAFKAVGGYDSSFSHNEDAEFDIRFIRAGYRIWLTNGVRFRYSPRTTPGQLAIQYYKFGRGRARTLLKHRETNARQIALAPVFPALLLLPVASRKPVLSAPFIAWGTACAIGGLAAAIRDRSVSRLGVGLAAGIMHVSWSAGFWDGLLRGRRARTSVEGEPFV